MKFSLETTLVILGLCFAFAQVQAKEDERPNVLFIAIDDLNDWIGCLDGHLQAKTPNIDRLANDGVLFTNAHCQAPICNPSRVSLLTGIRPSTSGVYELKQQLRQAPMLEGAMTIPAQFKANGYYVLGRGKIYHGKPYSDEWNDFKTAPDARNNQFREKPVSRLPKIRVRDFGPIDLPEEQFRDVINARWAAKELKRNFNKPFFMAVGFRLPHVPLYAPARFFLNHPKAEVSLPIIKEDDLSDLPAAAKKITRYMDSTPLNHRSILATKSWHEAVAAYLACTEFVDHCVGLIINSLSQSQYAKKTLIVLWSDHGWHLGEKQLWAKRSLWEESTRVPLIFSGPGLGRSRCDRPVQLLDIYPTLVELCSLTKPPQKLEGHSLLPLLSQPNSPWPYPAITTFHCNDHSVRTDRWRYISYANGDEELYDHSLDSNEWHNLVHNLKYQAVIAELKAHLPKVNVPQAR